MALLSEMVSPFSEVMIIGLRTLLSPSSDPYPSQSQMHNLSFASSKIMLNIHSILLAFILFRFEIE